MNQGCFQKKINLFVQYVLVLFMLLSLPIRSVKVNATENKIKDYSKINLEPWANNLKRFYINNKIEILNDTLICNTDIVVNKWWDIQKLEADLQMSIKKNIGISLLANGKEFYSNNLNYDPNTSNQKTKVQIPNSLIREGANRISVKIISEDKLLGYEVINISDKSNILVQFKDKEVTNNIDQFPYPFLRISENKYSKCNLLIPKNYTDEELEGALVLSSYLRRLSLNEEFRISLNRYTPELDNESKDIIYIGRYSNLPSEIKADYINPKNIDYSKTAVIEKVKVRSKKNKDIHSALIIVSDDDSLKTKAIKVLMNKKIVDSMKSNIFIVDQNTSLITDKRANSPVIEEKSKERDDKKRYSSYRFENYPKPFIIDNKFNNTALILPAYLNEDELNSLCYMVSYLGSSVLDESSTLKVINCNNFNDEHKNMNLIIYGTAKNNNIIRDLNEKLWFKYKTDYTKLLENEKLCFYDGYANNTAFFQFDKSPFNKKNAALILTSPNSDTLRKSIEYLSSERFSKRISGDGVVIDKYGNLKNFRFKQEMAEPISSQFKKLDNKPKKLIIYSIMLLIVLFIIVLLSSISKKVKRR
ncbi:cellulose biosynthesis cyclic di-GMP-binding regulatory protein BcsB [Clostridium manihotivorum]|uniref:Cellulose synthase n=1 Tax=Clostridium manihotivorum TaxID=2320868 RepID=A0A3R5QRQ7_9CLOT|nr:cellulose biosynthesis cyclic di-GMP-binding regulatory protein BcsB [Clostridium manihotivorum]QAA30877.1 hypothetical protein C1I91_03920 [Clostridium manihotivorum]